MTRTGKIALLPPAIRAQVNRDLHDARPTKDIADWLNALPEVRSIMDAEFNGQPVTERNISNWRQGGYHEWLAQQDALAAVRRSNTDTRELTQAASGQLADQVTLCLIARIAVALQQPVSSDDDPARQLLRLRRLCADLVALRRSDHYAQRLQMERELLDLEKDSIALADQIEEFDKTRPRGVSKEYLDWFAREYHLHGPSEPEKAQPDEPAK